MDPVTIGIIGTLLLLVLFFLGVPIGFAMGIAGIVGFAYVVNPSAAFHLVASDIFEQFNSYSLSVLPMFILMGCMAFSAGIGGKAFNAAYVLMGRLRGGLIVATAMGCCIFGALTGSSAATCVAIGKSAVPEMKKRGYDPAISLGALAASGTLGFMIPPSIPFAIYGILTEQSIGKLFIAGVLPGLLDHRAVRRHRPHCLLDKAGMGSGRGSDHDEAEAEGPPWPRRCADTLRPRHRRALRRDLQPDHGRGHRGCRRRRHRPGQTGADMEASRRRGSRTL